MTPWQQIAFKQLSKMIKDNLIVICKTDKGGKIIIVNYNDYNQIVFKELDKYKKLDNITMHNIDDHLNNIQKTAEQHVIQLHKLGALDDDLLKHTIGVKFYEHKGYQKIPGSTAKHFVCNKPGYAYPLFKTYKLTPSILKNVSVFDIPIRLLQSAGNITTSKITAFLEHILQPLSVNSVMQASMNIVVTANTTYRN